jgi:hypothetical protein
VRPQRAARSASESRSAGWSTSATACCLCAMLGDLSTEPDVVLEVRVLLQASPESAGSPRMYGSSVVTIARRSGT